jgi:ActR/RegA family two-component response regulator
MECIRTLVVGPPEEHDTFVAALVAHGCEVTTAHSTTETLRALSAREFDCLVGDLKFARNHEQELATAIRKLAPELPCLLYTATEDVSGSNSVAAFGFDNAYRINGQESVDRLVAEVVQAGRQDDDRVLTRTEELLSEISRVLVEATDRHLIEHRLCETFTDNPDFLAGWIGSTDTATQWFELSAASGFDDEIPMDYSIEALPLTLQRALETDHLKQCPTGSEDRSPLDPETVGGRRLIVVPLTYRQRRYGLLGLYPRDSVVTTRQEKQILNSLGTVIATGLHAVETARLLTTDQVITLQVEIRDSEFHLSQIAALVDTPVEYVGTTQTGSHREIYLTTADCLESPDSLTSLPFVEAARTLFTRNGKSTISITTTSSTVYDELTEYGGVGVETTAEATQALLTIDVPPTHDVRSLVDVLRSQYDTVELRGRTEQERRDWSPTEFTATVDDQLTDRQRTALEAAYHNAYFDWPRPIDGTEIAQTMGITRQTFHQHLRAAERKLVAAYVDS